MQSKIKRKVPWFPSLPNPHIKCLSGVHLNLFVTVIRAHIMIMRSVIFPFSLRNNFISMTEYNKTKKNVFSIIFDVDECF